MHDFTAGAYRGLACFAPWDVPLREAKASLSSYVAEAQRDRVLITRHGRPAALVIGVEGEELEDILTMGNPRFWEMIEVRRQSAKTVPLAEVRRRLHLRVPKRRRRSSGR